MFFILATKTAVHGKQYKRHYYSRQYDMCDKDKKVNIPYHAFSTIGYRLVAYLRKHITNKEDHRKPKSSNHCIPMINIILYTHKEISNDKEYRRRKIQDRME